MKGERSFSAAGTQSLCALLLNLEFGYSDVLCRLAIGLRADPTHFEGTNPASIPPPLEIARLSSGTLRVEYRSARRGLRLCELWVRSYRTGLWKQFPVGVDLGASWRKFF